ncbi:MAG TPA: CHAD domain-containing protein [Vicinamibacterales bacterium]
MERTSLSELLIRQRLMALTRFLPSARRGDVRSIHHARVATRRLREALPLVASGTRCRKLARTLQRLTRALGPVRELDVALMTLDELERAGDVPRPAIVRLRQVIEEERRRLHGEMRRLVDGTDLDKLGKRAVAAARKAPSAVARGRVRDPERLAVARRRAARRAATLRAAIENAAGIYLPDRLHEVRIAVKKLRYTLELARELSGSRAMAAIRTLKDVQDLLGRMHDLEILIARTRGVQGSPIGVNLRLSGDLDRVVRRLENECRQLHGHYMALRHKLLAICDRVEADSTQSEAAEPAA